MISRHLDYHTSPFTVLIEIFKFNQSISQSVNQSINQSNNQSVSQSVSQFSMLAESKSELDLVLIPASELWAYLFSAFCQKHCTTFFFICRFYNRIFLYDKYIIYGTIGNEIGEINTVQDLCILHRSDLETCTISILRNVIKLFLIKITSLPEDDIFCKENRIMTQYEGECA